MADKNGRKPKNIVLQILQDVIYDTHTELAKLDTHII